jgi:hypothetical protein
MRQLKRRQRPTYGAQYIPSLGNSTEFHFNIVSSSEQKGDIVVDGQRGFTRLSFDPMYLECCGHS